MTERKIDATTTPEQTNVYRETVNTAGTPMDDGSTRDVYQERVSGPAGEQVMRSEHISVPSDATRRGIGVTRIKQVLYFIFGAINVLLVIRFVLLLLGANQGSPFVDLIYGLSNVFVLPFNGIFGDPVFGASVFEWASIVGMIVYSLIAYGLARVVELIYAPVRPTVTGGS